MESQKVRHIEDGAAINLAFAGFIAISPDGTNWDYINGADCTVGKYRINISATAPNNHPARGQETGWMIVVKRNDVDGPILKFDVNKVENQSGWSTGTLAGADQAVQDITSWI